MSKEVKIMQKKTGIHKLGSNVLIFSIGSFASKLMGYFLLPFYTNILSKAEYGIYDIIITTVNLVFPIFTLLITESTMRFALDNSEDRRKVFSLSGLVMILGFMAALVVSPLILLSPTYKAFYLFFVIYYAVLAFHTFVTQFAKGIEETKKFAVSGIIGTAVTLTLNILLMAVIKLGLTGFFISAIAGMIASSIYLWFTCKMNRYIMRPQKSDFPLVKQMLGFSVPIMPNSLSWWISTSSDKYIISYVIGAAETGLYSVAYKIPSLMTVFSSIFLSAWQISSVEEFGTEKSREFYSKMYRYFFTFLVMVSSVIIAFVKQISSILFSKGFYAAWSFVPTLVVAYLFHDLAAFIGSVYTSSKKTKMLFYSTTLGAGLNIVLNIFIIPSMGGLGGAMTTLISYFVVWVIRIFDTSKIMKINFDTKTDILCLVLVVAQMILVTVGIPHSFVISLLIIVLLAGIKYKTIAEITSGTIGTALRRIKARG